MKRVLVTGGAGRLGRSVVQVLADEGYDVVSVDRVVATGLAGSQIVQDLTDHLATRDLVHRVRPSALVHLAAISVPFSAPEAEIFATNTGLTLTVLEAAQSAGVDEVLLSSSPTVFGYGAPAGWAPIALPIDEQHPVAPWNAYAVAKVAAEELVASYVRAGTTLRLGIFRPCYVITPEEWLGAPTQQGHTVRERLDDPALSAVALFNYVDARDAGQFVHAWLLHPGAAPNGTVYLVGANDSLVREPVAEALARFVPSTASLANGLAPTEAVFSSRRAERLLGWRASHTWRAELGEARYP